MPFTSSHHENLTTNINFPKFVRATWLNKEPIYEYQECLALVAYFEWMILQTLFICLYACSNVNDSDGHYYLEWLLWGRAAEI